MGCVTLGKLLTLSEPPHPPQLTWQQRGQRQGWWGQAGSVQTLKSPAAPRTKPAASSSSQILREARHPPAALGCQGHVCKLVTTQPGRPLEMLTAWCQQVPTPPWHGRLALGPLPLLSDNRAWFVYTDRGPRMQLASNIGTGRGARLAGAGAGRTGARRRLFSWTLGRHTCTFMQTRLRSLCGNESVCARVRSASHS